jgi:hypothetical protein
LCSTRHLASGISDFGQHLRHFLSLFLYRGPSFMEAAQDNECPSELEHRHGQQQDKRRGGQEEEAAPASIIFLEAPQVA